MLYRESFLFPAIACTVNYRCQFLDKNQFFPFFLKYRNPQQKAVILYISSHFGLQKWGFSSGSRLQIWDVSESIILHFPEKQFPAGLQSDGKIL